MCLHVSRVSFVFFTTYLNSDVFTFFVIYVSESQSRYGIMENLNSQKLEARNKLSGIQRDLKQSEINFNNVVSGLKNSIANDNLSYKDVHLNWKVNKQLEIGMKEKEFEQTIEKMRLEIKKKEESFESEHLKRIGDLGLKIKENEESFKVFNEMKSMEASAIESQIKELDNAIKSLKEMSKEQVK